MMFKVTALMMMCIVYGVNAFPSVLFARPPVIQDDTLDLQPPPLPGTTNFGDKFSPTFDSHKYISSSSGSHAQSFPQFPGTRNNAERIQIEPAHFRGTENLGEKAIPQDVIARMSKNHKY